MNTNVETILRVIAELLLAVGGLGGLITLVANKKGRNLENKKAELQISSDMPAQTASTLVQGAGDLVSQYQSLLNEYRAQTDKEISDLKAEQGAVKATIRRYGNRITYLMGGIQKLLEQLKDLDQAPCWQPDDWDPNER
jgi:hypothetical protein